LYSDEHVDKKAILFQNPYLKTENVPSHDTTLIPVSHATVPEFLSHGDE
jgi:hypothetical protein